MGTSKGTAAAVVWKRMGVWRGAGRGGGGTTEGERRRQSGGRGVGVEGRGIDDN